MKNHNGQMDIEDTRDGELIELGEGKRDTKGGPWGTNDGGMGWTMGF